MNAPRGNLSDGRSVLLVSIPRGDFRFKHRRVAYFPSADVAETYRQAYMKETWTGLLIVCLDSFDIKELEVFAILPTFV